MSASTGDVLYDRPFSFSPTSIALFRGHAKRDPSVGVFWSKSASFRQFQWRGESLREARSAVGFVGNSPPLSATADSLKSIGLADTHFSKAQNRGNSSFWAVSPMLKSLGNAYA